MTFLYALLLQVQLAQPCEAHDSMVARLSQIYGESRIGIGVSGPRVVFEIFANPLSKTWTIIRTSPSGISCLVATGFGWEMDEIGISI